VHNVGRHRATTAVAGLFGEQESGEQVNCVVSSIHQTGPLYPQLPTYRCGAANDVQGQNQTHAVQQAALLLDHRVGKREQRWRHLDAERLGGLEVDRQFVLGRRLHRQVGRLIALEDSATTP